MLNKYQKGHPNHKLCRTTKFYKLRKFITYGALFKKGVQAYHMIAKVKEFDYYIIFRKGRINVFVV